MMTRIGITDSITRVSLQEVMKRRTVEKMTWRPNRSIMEVLDVQAFWIMVVSLESLIMAYKGGHQ